MTGLAMGKEQNTLHGRMSGRRPIKLIITGAVASALLGRAQRRE